MPEPRGPSAAPPLAVVDIGSNSGRMIVVRFSGEGHLEIEADARATLRLVRDVDGAGRLGSAATSRVIDALRRFQAVAEVSGAASMVAVATAAVREASNCAEFVAGVADATGVEMEVISGDQEARYAFMGAVHGLPVESGMIVDVGGGSLELCRFRNRRPLRQWSLPLGAMRLTDRFLKGDPPKSGEISRLQTHVAETLADAAVGELRPDEAVVGTGGSVRALAKVRRAAHVYPIPRLHGYQLLASDIEGLADQLADRTASRRRNTPGLSPERAMSIVGGALCTETLLVSLHSAKLLVAGWGLREGVAIERLGIAMAAPRDVRGASVHSLCARFSTWRRDRAHRRAGIAATLLDELEGGSSADALELIDHAAILVDIGRSVDYYSRWQHSSAIVTAADLYGFGHRDIVMVAAVLERAGSGRVSLPGARLLLGPADRRLVDRLAVVLALAEHLTETSRDQHAPTLTVKRQMATLHVADAGIPADVTAGVQRAFGLRLRVDTARD